MLDDEESSRPVRGKALPTLASILLYGIIGTCALLVDVATLRSGLSLGLPRPASVACGFTVGTIVQFALNRRFNFRNRDKHVHLQFVAYLMVNLIGLAITVGCVEIFVRLFEVTATIARILTLPITVPMGFIAMRFFIFGNGLKNIRRLWASMI